MTQALAVATTLTAIVAAFPQALTVPPVPVGSISSPADMALFFVGMYGVVVGCGLFCAMGASAYRNLGLTLPLTLVPLVHAAVHAPDVMLGRWTAYGLLGFAIAPGILAGYFTRTTRRMRTEENEHLTRALRTYRWVLLAFSLALLAVAVPLLAFGQAWLKKPEVRAALSWYALALLAIQFLWCWLHFLRPFVEFSAAVPFRWMYKLRGHGPAMKTLPAFGPCLVVANHAAWFDPLYIATVLTRPVTPMMTASFYNVWFLRPILKHVIRVIAVPEVAVRSEAPELLEAVAALDRGECVLIFPEGFLRRKEETPLRRFGQGVWHILRERPSTPVFPIWIEGSWGGYFSYRGGPPTKGKRMDVRRPIDLAAAAPERVPAEVLADGMATRTFLMNRVLDARANLGLPPLPRFERPAPGDPDPLASSTAVPLPAEVSVSRTATTATGSGPDAAPPVDLN